MLPLPTLVAFAFVALGLVCSPGPNMLYLLSRSIIQGRTAGIISLGGVILGFVCYMLAAAFGITPIFLTVPWAFTLLKWAGAAYLLWLAWNAIKPGGSSVLAPRSLPVDPPQRLFAMGFMTNLLNPKAAVLYLTLLPQFENPAYGSILLQSLQLGFLQIAISFSVNLLIVLTASKSAKWLATHPTWLSVQRWVMAIVLLALALHLLLVH